MCRRKHNWCRRDTVDVGGRTVGVGGRTVGVGGRTVGVGGTNGDVDGSTVGVERSIFLYIYLCSDFFVSGHNVIHNVNSSKF